MDYENRYACEQYLDVLVTVELAEKLAMIDRRPVNRAIRSCWSAIRPRIDNKLNSQIFMAWRISLCRMVRCACCAVNLTKRLMRRVMMSEWIKCSDQTPDETDDYLTYSEFDGVPTNQVHTFFASKGYFSCETREDRFITHWMPLPEPPKE